MTKINEVYKCSVCGNIVEVVHTGPGQLVCCGKPMMLMTENTQDAAKEKHVPVIEKTECGYKVKVGSVAHPMDEKHYIEWIELIVDGHIMRKQLKPGDKPEAEFCCCAIPAEKGCGCSCSGATAKVSAREYCNLHGLWKAE